MDYLKHFDLCYKDKLLNTGHYSDRYNGFRIIFDNLLKKNKSSYIIIETGTIRDFGNWCDGQSTLLFYDFLRCVGGGLLSIDINDAYLEDCENNILNYNFTKDYNNKPEFVQVCDDSIETLNELICSVDLLYLDSFDLDISNPEPSMIHHLKEMLSAHKILRGNKDIIIAVDDNFTSIGKGKYVLEWAKTIKAEILHEGYQIIFKL